MLAFIELKGFIGKGSDFPRTVALSSGCVSFASFTDISPAIPSPSTSFV